MAKLSSLLILVAVSTVARAETTAQLYAKAVKEMETIRGMKNAASVDKLPAPVLEKPMPGDIAAQKRFEALSQAGVGDKVASAMILQRLRLEQLFAELKTHTSAELKKNELSEKSFVDVELFRDLVQDLSDVTAEQLLKLPVPSTDKAQECKLKAGDEWHALGKVVTARKVDKFNEQTIKTAKATGDMWAADSACRDEAWARKREFENIKNLTKLAGAYYQEVKEAIVSQRLGQKLAEINEHRIRHMYDNAPGVDDLDKPHATSAQE